LCRTKMPIFKGNISIPLLTAIARWRQSSADAVCLLLGSELDIGQLRRRCRRLVDALATIQLMFQFIEEYGATLSGIGNGSARP